jgi:hypothetical protein
MDDFGPPPELSKLHCFQTFPVYIHSFSTSAEERAALTFHYGVRGYRATEIIVHKMETAASRPELGLDAQIQSVGFQWYSI